MNEPLHLTRDLLAHPGSGPALTSNRAGSCSFDLLYPIDRTRVAQTWGDAEGAATQVSGEEIDGTEMVNRELEDPWVQPELVQPELIQPELVQLELGDRELVDWDATEAHCAPAAQITVPQTATAEVIPTKPALATDFIDLLIRKPGSASYETVAKAGTDRIGPSISPIVNRIANPMVNSMEAQAPQPAPNEPRSEADRLPSRDLLLQLPRVKTTRISSHRHSTNPALSLGILEDIGRVVSQWRDEIDGIHQQIQTLYRDGPILEAWLESAQGNNSPSLDPTPELSDSPSPSLNPADRKTYWICGLDEDGQPWREPCNPKDLPQVTRAIARYQTLRQLMSQKQHHEQRLNQLAKTLTVLRGRLRA
jgi:hypothetical protein